MCHGYCCHGYGALFYTVTIVVDIVVMVTVVMDMVYFLYCHYCCRYGCHGYCCQGYSALFYTVSTVVVLRINFYVTSQKLNAGEVRGREWWYSDCAITISTILYPASHL